jgi:hypothetical protein
MVLTRCLMTHASTAVLKLCQALTKQPHKQVARSIACRLTSTLAVAEIDTVSPSPEYTWTGTDKGHAEQSVQLDDARWLSGCVHRYLAHA